MERTLLNNNLITRYETKKTLTLQKKNKINTKSEAKQSRAAS